MKKVIIFVLCVIILLMASSCGSTKLEFDVTETSELTTIYLNSHYNVYIYRVNVMVPIGGREVELLEALQNGLITMDKVISDADNKVEPFIYLDGGSREYKLEDYTMILSYRVWDGDEYPDAIYFLPCDMGINDLDELNPLNTNSSYEVTEESNIPEDISSENSVNDSINVIYFFTDSTLEGTTPQIKNTFYLSDEQVEYLQSMISSHTFSDDYICDRISFFYNGKFVLGDGIEYYFGYDSSVLYYDHYFCSLTSDEVMYIKSICNT